MRIVLRLGATITALVALVAVLLPSTASAASRPSSVSSVSAYPGATVGTIKVTWKSGGSHVTKYRVETALTPFSATGQGRNHHSFTVKKSKRSVTLSAAKVATAGAAPATGNHLYIRVVALNGSRKGKASKLVASIALAPATPTTGLPLRIASYNIRSAVYDYADKRHWKVRAPGVAKEIMGVNPGIVAIQEATSGKVDGMRQTDSLQAAMLAADPELARYTLTRTTSYNPPGTRHGSQAARIMYDASRYALVSHCEDTTVVNGYLQSWSNTCSLELPIQKGDAPTWRRSAAYAEFASLATGQKFWVVSAHLDYRHSKNASTEAKLNQLRGAQAAWIWSQMSALRAVGEPVIVAGDFNASQADPGGNAPHDYLVSQGFYDTAGTSHEVNLELPSLNHFDKTLKPDPQGYARRVDQILVNGTVGSSKFKLVSKNPDPARNSDHSMVYTDIVLPS